MSRVCRNMEDSGKHRFHGLEHDSKMRLFTTYSHTSTLKGSEASGKSCSKKPQTTHEHLLRTSTAPVEPDTARRTRGDSTTFGQRSRGICPIFCADDSLLSSSRTGFELRAPVDPQSMGAERATYGDVSPTRDNSPPPMTVRPAPRSTSATQCPHRAALRASTIPSEISPPSN